MSTQKPSQLRNSFLKAIAKQATLGIALVGMSLPLYTLMIGQPAIAAHHHKQKQNPVTPDVMPTPNQGPARSQTNATKSHTNGKLFLPL